MRRRLLSLGILAGLAAASCVRAGPQEDLEAVIFGGASALHRDLGYRALDTDRIRWKALRETVSLMLTAVEASTSRAGEVVAQTPLEPDWTTGEYVDHLVATARQLGRDHSEAIEAGARHAIETFRLDQVAPAGTTLRNLTRIREGLRTRSTIEGVPLASFQRPENLADPSELDVIARQLREGLSGL